MGIDLTFSKKMLQLMSDSDRQEPARLPKGSWLPFPRNPQFALRQDPLQALISLMLYKDGEEVSTQQQPVAIVGPDGSGKTQLALEFCYRCGHLFDGVHWIDTRHNSYLSAEIAMNGQVMSLPNWLNMIQEQARSTLSLWQSAHHLVVLDNLEDPEQVPEILKTLGHVQVLITTTSDRWLRESGIQVYNLEPMECKESLSLLRKVAPRLKKEKDAELEQLCVLAGNLALAVSLAGSHLKDYPRMSVKGYLAELEKAVAAPDPLLHDWLRRTTVSQPTNMAAIFMHSLGHLDPKSEQDQIARQILHLAGYCAPDIPIPPALLRKAIKAGDTGSLKTDFERALEDLYHLGLLVQTEEGPVVHCLVAELIRLTEGSRDGVIGKLAEAMVTLGQGYERRPLRESIIIRAHFETAMPYIEGAGLKQAGTLWSSLGYEYWMMGNHARSKICYERAIELDEKAFGPKDYRIAAEYYNLGRVLADNKDLLGAKDAYIRASAISSDYKVATEFYNIGNLLADQRERLAAKDCLERAAGIIEKIYGTEYPLYASYISRLGEILFDLDEYNAANSCFERVLSIHEKAYSSRPNHTQLAMDASHLGHVLKRQGDLQGAKTYFERALAINENPLNYGRDHLQVARDANNLGRVLRALGDLEGARACFERVLKINEQSRGLDLSDVTKALINMGLTLRELGQQEEAKPYFEKALAIDEIVYSTSDSSVATDVHRLGIALRSMGELPKAKACFERAVELEERVHGPEHANVATNLHHLARVLHEMKDLPAAKICYERALEIDRKRYGPQHSYVATDINDLGSLLQDIRDLEGAKSCFMQARKIDEMAHGLEHPNVARDINNLASVQKAMGDLQGALDSFAQAANIFEMFYGADHPKTKIVRQNQASVRRRLELKK
jgi:tetratricopeptide (TPR) repeat protein